VIYYKEFSGGVKMLKIMRSVYVFVLDTFMFLIALAGTMIYEWLAPVDKNGHKLYW
jgi:hypothetical protein